MKAETRKLLDRAVEIQAILNQVKPLYNELDEIIAELVRVGFKREAFFSGYELILVDNFEKKNTVFKATGIRRFDLKIEKKVERVLIKSQKTEIFKIRSRKAK